MNKKKRKSAEALCAARKRELDKAPAMEEVVRGTLLRYLLTCGKAGCRCHRSARHRHGPYWYVAVSYAGGRQRRYLIPGAHVARARRGIAAYKRLWRSLYRISELNLELLRVEL